MEDCIGIIERLIIALRNDSNCVGTVKSYLDSLFKAIIGSIKSSPSTQMNMYMAAISGIISDMKEASDSDMIVENLDALKTILDGYVFNEFNVNNIIMNEEIALDKITMDKEYDKFMGMILKGENFAFMRNADGELAIMEGRAVNAQEGNWSSPDYVTKLGEDIYKSLSLVGDNVYYAISCPCCDRRAYYWYASRVANPHNITFANLWINSNYRHFLEDFCKIKRDAILIANFRAEGHSFGNLNILKHYHISDDCISFWENEAEEMLERIKKDFGDRNDLLYVVSCGPMSAPIIADLYTNNPNNCYVDFGSSVDCFYREGITRPYMLPDNVYYSRNCWMHNPKTVSFDVTAICTMYKKPEALRKQLNAIKKQTLKPREIFLFKDGIDKDYSINLKDELVSEFDKVTIMDHNVGVWERFKMALETKTKYFCMFDDDTIPGERWFENCHFYSQMNPGIYGTSGILMTDIYDYPAKQRAIGWKYPLSTLVKVDFVGHSWFSECETVQYLFEGTEKYQRYKVVGEDMCFSAKAKEHGINSFVPPHSIIRPPCWGSNREDGLQYGGNSAAISMNPDNLKSMKECSNEVVKDGWVPILVENPGCVLATQYLRVIEDEWFRSLQEN